MLRSCASTNSGFRKYIQTQHIEAWSTSSSPYHTCFCMGHERRCFAANSILSAKAQHMRESHLAADSEPGSVRDLPYLTAGLWRHLDAFASSAPVQAVHLLSLTRAGVDMLQIH